MLLVFAARALVKALPAFIGVFGVVCPYVLFLVYVVVFAIQLVPFNGWRVMRVDNLQG